MSIQNLQQPDGIVYGATYSPSGILGYPAGMQGGAIYSSGAGTRG